MESGYQLTLHPSKWVPPMTDPKLPAAKRRLRVFMSEPERGAQLARLNRRDEREILDLIYENRGREARRRLDQLDARRRGTRTLKDRVRRYLRLPEPLRKTERPEHEEREFWDLYDRGEAA